MFIENYIPFGYKNRISRETLEALTRQGDRTNRERIAEALQERRVLIVNIDNAYFRPDGSQKHTTGGNARAQEAVKSDAMLSANALGQKNRMNYLRTR